MGTVDYDLRHKGILMKLISTISELRKGDTVIVKDQLRFEEMGLRSISGDVFDIEAEKQSFIIKCKETSSLEEISVKGGKIFLIG